MFPSHSPFDERLFRLVEENANRAFISGQILQLLLKRSTKVNGLIGSMWPEPAVQQSALIHSSNSPGLYGAELIAHTFHHLLCGMPRTLVHFAWNCQNTVLGHIFIFFFFWMRRS